MKTVTHLHPPFSPLPTLSALSRSCEAHCKLGGLHSNSVSARLNTSLPPVNISRKIPSACKDFFLTPLPSKLSTSLQLPAFGVPLFAQTSIMSASPALAYVHPGLSFLSPMETNGHSSSQIVPPSSALSMDAPSSSLPRQNGTSHLPSSESNGHLDGDLSSYRFPDHRLKRKLEDPSRSPLVLVSCGSFSPITNLHLRMFEMVRDHIKFDTNYEIVGGYFSPVSDDYKKVGLASAHHR